MKDIQMVFFVNQGDSRICENRELFTLKNQILLYKEIKYHVIRAKYVYTALQAYAHFYYRWSTSAAMDR